MGATISNGTSTITPTLVLSYESSRPTGTKVHQLLNGNTAVSLRPAGLRQGELALFFPDEQDAAAAEAFHTDPAVFTLTYPERPTVGMLYVLGEGGQLTRELDDETRDYWVVRVPFQEVLQ